MSPRTRALTQIGAVILGLVFIKYIWPRPPYGMGFWPLTSAAAPYLIWLPPLAVFAYRARAIPVVLALVANLALVVAYHKTVVFLAWWERYRFELEQHCDKAGTVCFGWPIMDPPPPPQYWQLAVAGFFALLTLLYLALAAEQRRTETRTGGKP